MNILHLWRMGKIDIFESEENNSEERQKVKDDIDKFGCHLIAVEADEYLPGFVYSIGFHQGFNQPEIICFGLKTDSLAVIINHACDLVKQGETLKPYVSYSGFLEGFDVQFVPVDKDYFQHYLGYGGWYNGMNFDLSGD